MTTPLEPLVQTLLFEGYALYPYTPGDVKNATPTPFGIVYPPAYAAASKYTFDNLLLDALCEGGDEVFGDVRFLQGTGDQYQAVPRRLEIDWVPLDGVERELDFAFGDIVGRVILRPSPGRVQLEVRNETPGYADAERRAVMPAALISTQAVLYIRGGTFVSPLDGGTASVNTFPVLGTDDDTAMLGATIMLPDHPQLAPESKVNFFDSTEIEEALMIHVQTLSDEDRQEMAHGDPAVAEMIGRALAASPKDIFDLHGRTEIAGHPAAGEQEVVVDGVAYRPTMKVVLHPTSRDPYDTMLAGRTGTIHRIYIDYEDRTHLGITVDDDPVGDMMRDTGRYLYFFPPEVELLEA